MQQPSTTDALGLAAMALFATLTVRLREKELFDQADFESTITQTIATLRKTGDPDLAKKAVAAINAFFPEIEVH